MYSNAAQQIRMNQFQVIPNISEHLFEHSWSTSAYAQTLRWFLHLHLFSKLKRLQWNVWCRDERWLFDSYGLFRYTLNACVLTASEREKNRNSPANRNERRTTSNAMSISNRVSLQNVYIEFVDHWWPSRTMTVLCGWIRHCYWAERKHWAKSRHVMMSETTICNPFERNPMYVCVRACLCYPMCTFHVLQCMACVEPDSNSPQRL